MAAGAILINGKITMSLLPLYVGPHSIQLGSGSDDYGSGQILTA